MDDIISIHAAKTHLSTLLVRVEAGEVITIAPGRTLLARPVPIVRKGKREFRAMRGKCAGPESRSPALQRVSGHRGTSEWVGAGRASPVISHPQLLLQEVGPAAQSAGGGTGEDHRTLDEDDVVFGERIDRGVVPVDDSDGNADSTGPGQGPHAIEN